MKHLAKRMLALVCVAAMVMALMVITPIAAYAAEDSEPDDGEYIGIVTLPEYLPEDYDTEAAVPVSSSSVHVSEETHFSFTPNVTGYWTFVTSNSPAEVYPFLRITNHYGHVLASDWGSAPDGNAIIKLHLVEGAPYVVQAGFDWGQGRYTLTVFVSETFERPVRPAPIPEEMPGEGGTVSGYGDLFYSFIPDTTGFWEFDITTDDWLLDVHIEDSRHNMLALNLNSWEPPFNATIRLVAGQEYFIRGWTDFWDSPYTITVTPTDTFEPWVDWDVLANWGYVVDFDADRVIIPPEGGETLIEETAHLSFTPESSGLWAFDVSYAEFDTFVIVTDSYGSFLTPIEAGGWWGQGVVALYLLEDVEYVIWVSNMWADDFFLNLVLLPYDEVDWDYDWDLDIDWGDEWGWDMGTIIPSTGGSFSLEDESWFLFTPDVMSSWTIQIIDEGWGWNDLRIFDPSHSFSITEWDSGSISVHLAPGVEYTIDAWASWDAVNAYLHVSPTYEIHPTSAARVSRRVASETYFTFTPHESGNWVIFTTQTTGGTDPMIWLLDAEGNEVAYDDDGGEGLNSLIKIYLEAGTEYVIRAGFFVGGGGYVLNVQLLGGEQERTELVELVPPPL